MAFSKVALNYAKAYQNALEQEFPYVLYFGALFSAPNNGRFRWVNSNVIEVPTISTSGRVDGDRDSIGTRKRNFNNTWTPLTLANHRSWETLVHPRDIDETNGVVSIANITRVFNDEQKFPEMNAYLISKVYSDFVEQGGQVDTTVLTTENVLTVFGNLMKAMDEARVPRQGRILYVTPDTRDLIENAKQIYRTLDVSSASQAVRLAITSIDSVEIPESVPSDMMKTLYDFTEGWAVDDDAAQINMFLVHPQAVITPISYEFAQLDAPSAGSQGKWEYFEESFEDVFLLPHKRAAVAFNVTPAGEQAGITLDKTTATVVKDATTTLTATTVPADAVVTWASSDSDVATVSDGTVTGVAAGTATITATITVDGTDYSASCAVTVTAE